MNGLVVSRPSPEASAEVDPGGSARGVEGVALLEHLLGGEGVLVRGLGLLLDPRLLLEARDGLLEGLQVGEDQLGVDRLDVRARRDLAVDVHHVAVLEGAHDLADGVGLADVGEELVAQPLPLGRAAHDAGDVDEGHRGREDLLAAEDLRQPREPLVGERDDAHVGVDRRERVVRREDVVLGQGVEHRRLADVRETDDSDLKCHEAESLPARAVAPGQGPGAGGPGPLRSSS